MSICPRRAHISCAHDFWLPRELSSLDSLGPFKPQQIGSAKKKVIVFPEEEEILGRLETGQETMTVFRIIICRSSLWQNLHCQTSCLLKLDHDKSLTSVPTEMPTFLSARVEDVYPLHSETISSSQAKNETEWWKKNSERNNNSLGM